MNKMIVTASKLFIMFINFLKLFLHSKCLIHLLEVQLNITCLFKQYKLLMKM